MCDADREGNKKTAEENGNKIEALLQGVADFSKKNEDNSKDPKTVCPRVAKEK